MVPFKGMLAFAELGILGILIRTSRSQSSFTDLLSAFNACDRYTDLTLEKCDTNPSFPECAAGLESLTVVKRAAKNSSETPTQTTLTTYA